MVCAGGVFLDGTVVQCFNLARFSEFSLLFLVIMFSFEDFRGSAEKSDGRSERMRAMLGYNAFFPFSGFLSSARYNFDFFLAFLVPNHACRPGESTLD